MAAIRTTHIPVMFLRENREEPLLSEETQLLLPFPDSSVCRLFLAYRSPRCMFPIMALDENVAPVTASTFMFIASSIVLPFHFSNRAEALSKNSFVSSFFSATMFSTTPFLMTMLSGTFPPYPVMSDASAEVLMTAVPFPSMRRVSLFAACGFCSDRKECPNSSPCFTIASEETMTRQMKRLNNCFVLKNDFIFKSVVSYFLFVTVVSLTEVSQVLPHTP